MSDPTDEPSANEPDFYTIQKGWWLQLYTELQCDPALLSISSLVRKLQISQEYESYCTSYFSTFWELAMHVPVYTSKQMCSLDLTYFQQHQNIPCAKAQRVVAGFHAHMSSIKEYKQFACIGMRGQNSIRTYFSELWSIVSTMEFKFQNSYSSLGARYCLIGRQKPQTLRNHTIDMELHYTAYSTPTLGSVHMGVKFVESQCHDRPTNIDIGQMAEYAQSVRALQPKRKCVPILFIDNTCTTMLLFGNVKVVTVGLGRLCHHGTLPIPTSVFAISSILRNLCFMLILPPHYFNHVFN